MKFKLKTYFGCETKNSYKNVCAFYNPKFHKAKPEQFKQFKQSTPNWFIPISILAISIEVIILFYLIYMLLENQKSDQANSPPISSPIDYFRAKGARI